LVPGSITASVLVNKGLDETLLVFVVQGELGKGVLFTHGLSIVEFRSRDDTDRERSGAGVLTVGGRRGEDGLAVLSHDLRTGRVGRG